MTNNISELKKRLLILVELGLYEHAEIWSSMFCVGLDIEHTEAYIYISWYRFDTSFDSHLIIF